MVIIAKHENKTILIYKQTNSIFSLPSAPPLEKFWFSGLLFVFSFLWWLFAGNFITKSTFTGVSKAKQNRIWVEENEVSAHELIRHIPGPKNMFDN